MSETEEIDDTTAQTSHEASLRNEFLKRVCGYLILAQFLAPILLCFRSVLPPVIGIGSFSVAVDFRYLGAALIGASLSLLVLLPFLFAWVFDSTSRRLFCLLFAVLVMLINWAQFLVSQIGLAGLAAVLYTGLEQNALPASIAMLTYLGFVVIPLAIRAYYGFQIVDSTRQDSLIPKQQRIVDTAILALILGIIFLSGIFFGGSSVAGLPFHVVGALYGTAGMVIGGVLALPVWLLFRESKLPLFPIVILIAFVLLVAVPCFFAWLADYSGRKVFTPGSGIYFVGLAAGATLCLVHVTLFRAMGYRSKTLCFETAKVAPVQKVVVDPFSD